MKFYFEKTQWIDLTQAVTLCHIEGWEADRLIERIGEIVPDLSEKERLSVAKWLIDEFQIKFRELRRERPACSKETVFSLIEEKMRDDR